MTFQLKAWGLEQYAGQWILSYCGGPEVSVRLYARGSINERAGSDPRRIASQVSGEFRGFALSSPRQVHGRTVIIAEKASCLPVRPEADGLFMWRTDIAGSLQFADCVPVILYGRVPYNWLALGHSGFAGTGKNMVSAMLSNVLEICGPGSLEGVVAWVGPGICRECYGRKFEDPSTRWGRKVFPGEYVILKKEMVYFDLPGMIEQQLLDLGIPKSAVSRIPYCTRCRNDIFYSCRAGDMRRNVLFARIISRGHKDNHSGENNCSGPRFSAIPILECDH
ncbi:MAG: polyphenol oxidase family protein [Thermovirgaceae bacterium]